MFKVYDKRSWHGISILYRMLGNYVALNLAETKITANSITLVGLIFGILAGTFLMVGKPLFVIVALIFIQVYMVMDYVDGTLARLRNEVSLYGKILDRLAGRVVFVVINFGIAFMFRHDPIIIFGVLTIVPSRHLTYIIDQYFYRKDPVLRGSKTKSSCKSVLKAFFPTNIASYYLLFSFAYFLGLVRLFIVYSAIFFVMRLFYRTGNVKMENIIVDNNSTE